jgi:hypothetical protein
MKNLCNDIKDTATLLLQLARGKGARTDYLLIGSTFAAGLAIGSSLL